MLASLKNKLFKVGLRPEAIQSMFIFIGTVTTPREKKKKNPGEILEWLCSSSKK